MKYVPVFLYIFFISCCFTESVVVPEGTHLNRQKYDIVRECDAGVLYVPINDSIVKLKHIFYKEK